MAHAHFSTTGQRPGMPDPDGTGARAAVQLTGAAANLRHDLRNAVMPLLLHLDLLSMRAPSPQLPLALVQPGTLVADLQRLANGLLLRNTDTATLADPAGLALAPFWRELGELICAPLLRGHQTRVSLPEALPPVQIHSAVLAQVLLHLMIGVRLTQAGDAAPAVYVTARRRGDEVTVTVRDRVAPVVRRREVERDLTSSWGIAFAQELLRRAGGDLRGSSSVAHGTYVVLHLRAGTAAHLGLPTSSAARRAVAPAPVPLVEAAPPPEAHVALPLLTRVLIIDDNAALTGALELRLSLDGRFECAPPLHALNDAVAYITAHAPRVVLLDLNLPGDEGPLDVIRGLAARGSAAHVVVFTGNASRAAIDATREAGAAGFISKGVSPDRLLAALRRVGQEPFVLELDA